MLGNIVFSYVVRMENQPLNTMCARTRDPGAGGPRVPFLIRGAALVSTLRLPLSPRTIEADPVVPEWLPSLGGDVSG